MSDIRVISHYGTKGMRWGVRKARGGAKKFLTGDPSTSVLHPKGRAAATSAGKAAVGKISNNKVFKAVVFNKDYTLLTKNGRKGVAGLFKKNAEKRYAKAEKKAEKKMEAKRKRAKDTKKLIDSLISDDKASAKKWGKNFDEAGTRKYWNNLFKKELDVSEE